MPLNRKYAVLLSGTGTTMSEYSTEVRGDSYYGYTDGLHTVQVTYNQFVGRVRIQCSLAIEPTADDWFDVKPSNSMKIIMCSLMQITPQMVLKHTHSRATLLG
jgi:hypothetical protein